MGEQNSLRFIRNMNAGLMRRYEREVHILHENVKSLDYDEIIASASRLKSLTGRINLLNDVTRVVGPELEEWQEEGGEE